MLGGNVVTSCRGQEMEVSAFQEKMFRYIARLEAKLCVDLRGCGFLGVSRDLSYE